MTETPDIVDGEFAGIEIYRVGWRLYTYRLWWGKALIMGFSTRRGCRDAAAKFISLHVWQEHG